MLTALGVALSFGGAVTAFGALSKLRAESCPSCDAIGTLVVVRLDFDDFPGQRPISTRSRRCTACRCMVIDHERAIGHPRLARLATLAHFGR